uniref:Acyl-coenzyme A thioesterase 13 n=1 Tax=Strix occidentalis caurina TaxID=311401 RepID=A0A8D0KUU1_STROC
TQRRMAGKGPPPGRTEAVGKPHPPGLPFRGAGGRRGGQGSMGCTVESLREAIKYMVESQGFDRVLRKMKLLSATPGKVVCEMKVEEEHTNRGGTLHGGLTATLVDVVSTAALLYTERAVPGVSVDMNITYTSAAKIGEEILITAQILKQGRSIAFASVDLTDKATGKLIAQGRHTKYLGSNTSK